MLLPLNLCYLRRANGCLLPGRLHGQPRRTCGRPVSFPHPTQQPSHASSNHAVDSVREEPSDSQVSYLDGVCPSSTIDDLNNFRQALRDICNSKWFEVTMLCLIIANVVTLAMDTPLASEDMKETLDYFNVIFLILFTIEMVIKMVAFGLIGKTPPGYFRSGMQTTLLPPVRMRGPVYLYIGAVCAAVCCISCIFDNFCPPRFAFC